MQYSDTSYIYIIYESKKTTHEKQKAIRTPLDVLSGCHSSGLPQRRWWKIIDTPEFSAKELEVPLGGTGITEVLANDEVILEVTDPDIATAALISETNAYTPKRYVYVAGVKKGETTLQLTDKLTEKKSYYL